MALQKGSHLIFLIQTGICLSCTEVNIRDYDELLILRSDPNNLTLS